MRLPLLCLTVAVCSAQTPARQYVITTIAGSRSVRDDGPATDALLYQPVTTVFDKSGNLYIADTTHHRVRKVARDGRISTIVGDGIGGARGDGGPAANARIDSPVGLVFDAEESLYILERPGGTGRLRKVTLDGKIRSVPSGTLTIAQALTIDRSGNLYIANAGANMIRKLAPDGKFTDVRADLNNPQAVAVDVSGTLYIADTDNHRVRKVSTDGAVSTYVGGGGAGSSGDGGPATMARLNYPRGLAVDGTGNLYVSEGFGFRVRKVSPGGVISTVAGTGVRGFSGDGGPASNAQFAELNGLTLDGAGNLYVADNGNHRIRKVTPEGSISTVAGSSHFRGDGGPATAATLFQPADLAADASGNLYVADQNNNRIRRIGPDGVITTVAGSSDVQGQSSGGGRPTNARLNRPNGVAVDAEGTLYFTDTFNFLLYRVTGQGQLVRVAGDGTNQTSGERVPASGAGTTFPDFLAFDKAGNLYLAEGGSSHRVRKIAALDNLISTFAGSGEGGFGGDGGPATAAKLKFPNGLAAGPEGNIYISERDNDRIRKVTPDGRISTIAGNGERGGTGDGGLATSARFNGPRQLAVDPSGQLLYVSDWGNHKVRVIDLVTGVIDAIAGTGTTGYSGDGGLATLAQLQTPGGLIMDPAGNIYVSEGNGHRIRKLTPLVATQLALVGGDAQTGAPGQRLPIALSVRVTGAGGVGVPGVTVTFKVVEGSATLGTSSAMTQADGSATVEVTLGSAPGKVVVAASVAGLQTQRFTLIAAPRIEKDGIVGAPMSVPPVRQVSPNALVSILGEGFVSEGADETVTSGVCVRFGAEPAPVFRLTPRQIDVQVPSLAAPGEAIVTVVANCGKPDEVSSEGATVGVLPATPEFFYFVRNPDGRNPVRAVNKESGANVGGEFAPAKPGDTISLFATGFGLTDPAFKAGEAPAAEAPLAARAVVTLGSVELPEASLQYAGVHPGAPGLYRLDIRIPPDIPDGDLPVVVRIGDSASPPGGYLTVRR